MKGWEPEFIMSPLNSKSQNEVCKQNTARKLQWRKVNSHHSEIYDLDKREREREKNTAGKISFLLLFQSSFFSLGCLRLPILPANTLLVYPIFFFNSSFVLLVWFSPSLLAGTEEAKPSKNQTLKKYTYKLAQKIK